MAALAASRPAGAASTGTFPVTISNCGTSTIYTKAPTRAVSNDINTTEDMLSLGLESHMVGDFGVNGDGPAGQPVPSRYLAAFHKVRDISPDYFTLEKLVSLRPDFLFAGWNYGLQMGTNLTPTNLAKYHINTLALTESCADVQTATQTVSINDTYTDLTDLGEIFGVEARATKLIASMQAQVASARAKVAHLPPVTVFDYDSGTSAPFTGPGLAMPNALISRGRRHQHLQQVSSRAGPRCRGSKWWQPILSASSSTTTAHRRQRKRRSFWRVPRSPRTSRRSRTSASCL